MDTSAESTRTCRLGERLYLANADTIRCGVANLLDTAGIERVVLDAEGVRECDSHGVRLLLALQRHATRRGKSLLLYRPATTVRDVLEGAGIASMFTVVETLEPGQS
jgi:anti-anti-sigma factor